MVLPKPKRGRKKIRKNTRKLISFDIAFFFGLKYHLSYYIYHIFLKSLLAHSMSFLLLNLFLGKRIHFYEVRENDFAHPDF